MKVELIDLLEAVETAGGGLSSDEPAMAWPIFIGDSESEHAISAGSVEVRDGKVIVRLPPALKIVTA